MNPIDSTDAWVGEYLVWTQPDGWSVNSSAPLHGVALQSSADPGEEYVSAYLDWMNLAEPVRARSPYRTAAWDSVGSGGEESGLEVLEGALLAALRVESDFLQLLQGILDDGSTPPRIVKFASRSVRHAERLLEDERDAWRTLAGMRRYNFAHSRAAWDPGYETKWPPALEEVAAEVHALKGTVQAMRHP